jgi:hypothetical protein
VIRIAGLIAAFGVAAVLAACGSSHRATSSSCGFMRGHTRAALCVAGKLIALPDMFSRTGRFTCGDVPSVHLSNRTAPTLLLRGVGAATVQFSYGLGGTQEKLRHSGTGWKIAPGRSLPAGHYPSGFAEIYVLGHSPAIHTGEYEFCFVRPELPARYTRQQVAAVIRTTLRRPKGSWHRHGGSDIFSVHVPGIPEVHIAGGPVQIIVAQSASHCCAGVALPVGHGYHLDHARNVWFSYRGRHAEDYTEIVKSYLG